MKKGYSNIINRSVPLGESFNRQEYLSKLKSDISDRIFRKIIQGSSFAVWLKFEIEVNETIDAGDVVLTTFILSNELNVRAAYVFAEFALSEEVLSKIPAEGNASVCIKFGVYETIDDYIAVCKTQTY